METNRESAIVSVIWGFLASGRHFIRVERANGDWCESFEGVVK
jgi:hypothetical protein